MDEKLGTRNKDQGTEEQRLIMKEERWRWRMRNEDEGRMRNEDEEWEMKMKDEKWRWRMRNQDEGRELIGGMMKNAVES